MHIAFIHPDLGLGGAERLIIDAALSLQSLGHQCTIYTPYHDPARTFSDVHLHHLSPLHNDKPSVPVVVVPTPFPRTFFGRLHAVLAALRCLCVTLYVLCLRFYGRGGGGRVCDVAFVDLVSAPLLLLFFARVPTMFYCHFPDTLLAQSLQTQRHNQRSRLYRIKRVYRVVIDGLDALAMRAASRVLCNSEYTASHYKQVFPNLLPPTIVYPVVQLSEPCAAEKSDDVNESIFPNGYILSLNRFESKKNIPLAVHAYNHYVTTHHPQNPPSLILAGGHDPRLPDNRETYADIVAAVESHSLSECTHIRCNVSDRERGALLRGARCLVYTPEGEHFGIGPVEAMAVGVPVVAVDGGGVRETVVDGVTGMLCSGGVEGLSEGMSVVLKEGEKATKMGEMGRERVRKCFSPQRMGQQLGDIVSQIVRVR